MINFLNNFLKKNNNIDLGNKFFLIGVFFLPSALPISVLCLILSLIIRFKKSKFEFSYKSWDLPLFLSIGIIIFSTFNITFINKSSILSEYSYSAIWINLFNWIPIFFFYWGFQNYLKTDSQKIIFTKYLFSGSIPVITSMLLQKFFNFHGPFKTLFGLIVWFQKPIVHNTDPISGLFSNPNYAAIWLVVLFPFAILLLKRSQSHTIQNTFLLIFCLLIVYVILLTGSRNGILGIIVGTIFIFGYKKILILAIPIVSLIPIRGFFSFLINKEWLFFNILSISNLIDKLKFESISVLPRLDIWKSALVRIQERPFLGWGGSTFSYLHLEHNPTFWTPKIIMNAQHSHNIVLELAHNFGIPLSIILITTVLLLLIRSWAYIFIKLPSNNDLLVKKVWLSSSVTVFVSHLSDVTYYDGKISILISILFAGLKCIHDEQYD